MRPVGREGRRVDYTYRRVASGGFEETRETVERSAETRGFAIRYVHDIQAALAAKGFPIQPLCIYELWLRDDTALAEHEAVALMPCRLHVYQEGGDVCVAAIRPTLSALMFPELEFAGVDDDLERAVTALVDDCAAPAVT